MTMHIGTKKETNFSEMLYFLGDPKHMIYLHQRIPLFPHFKVRKGRVNVFLRIAKISFVPLNRRRALFQRFLIVSSQYTTDKYTQNPRLHVDAWTEVH